ncbi:toll/interleukin-1 receptor domain-containing protein [Polyangium aurulentum]|uniref:toll/interleukin-1 receptor domain-containing protein n=1 Tax=Polyangium aurulentum TaxID=2567896 RepID=UPI0010ADF0AA|nr:toll/interleukin-1 receptor domain-containing protein [Polyangium aurulentum]UQA58929.1 toll/interleukin-1 receptor domain-containing protein [Polyangium aurulentum]
MGNAVELFISSAPSGLALRAELARRLQPLVDAGFVRDVMVPDPPAEAEQKGLGSADLVVLLLCPDALAPGSPTEAEIAQALDMEREGRAVVVPVLARPCNLGPLAERPCWPRAGVPLDAALDTDSAFADVLAGVLRGVSQCHMTVGDLLLSQQREAAAAAAFRRALAIAERLYQQAPHDDERLEHFARARDRLGDALLAAGDGPGSHEAFEDARQSYEDLCARAPTEPARRALARCYESIGEVLRAMGDKPPALAALTTCLQMRMSLAKDVRTPEATRDVYQTHAKIGHVLRAMGDLPAAFEAFQAGLVLSDVLAAACPEEATFQADVALFCFRAATVLAEGDATERAGARELLLRAREIYRVLDESARLPEAQSIWPPAVEAMLDTLDL